MVMKQRSGQLLIKYLTNERQIIKLSKACTAQDSLLLNAIAMVARDLDRSELSTKTSGTRQTAVCHKRLTGKTADYNPTHFKQGL